LGWLGVLTPEEYGGMGLKLADMAIVAQGLARVLVPEPLAATAVMAARVLADSGNEALKEKLLPSLVAGDVLPAVAWQEQAGSLDAANIETSATPFEGGFRVNGTKKFVMGATNADGYLVSANAKDGTHILWVPNDAAGVSVTFDQLADGRQSATVNLKDVAVARDNVVNSGTAAMKSLARALDHTAVIVSAELTGIMSRSLEITLDYLKTRVQFGKPIGSFQALQHRAVDLYIQQELSSAVLNDVLAALDEEPDDNTRAAAASRAKARCTDAALLITRQAIQMHGAIGFTEDCDVGLYVKRAMTLAAWLGNGHAHKRRYAKTEILEGAV
jgi:alkylation response protein AidB-like acyl-CoA dehydrogenase